MKKFVSLVCILGMFTFIAPTAGAIPVTESNSTVGQSQVESVTGESATQNDILTAHPKRRQAKTRLTEPVIQNDILTAHPKRRRTDKNV